MRGVLIQAEACRRGARILLVCCTLCVNFAVGWTAEVEADDVAAEDVELVPMTGMSDPRLSPLDDLLRDFVRTRHVPGAALALSKDGRQLSARGFGYSDREAREVLQPDSLFRIASISKPVTAVAVLRLVEQGQLTLDARVAELLQIKPHLPAGTTLDPRLAQITVRQLLHHTGGWDSSLGFEPIVRHAEIARTLGIELPIQPRDLLRFMWGRPLDFDPGSRYAYSNFGYCVLGRVIERVSGESYESYVQQQVWRPLGCTTPRLGRTAREGRFPGEVVYYDEHTDSGVIAGTLGKTVPRPYGAWSLESMDAHGGWIASAPDLIRFAVAFDDPAHSPLLRPESIATLLARPEGSAGHNADGSPKDAYYACGWMVRPHATGRLPTLWHAGALDGTSTLLVRRFDGVTWAILFNSTYGLEGKRLAADIEPLLHETVNRIFQPE